MFIISILNESSFGRNDCLLTTWCWIRKIMKSCFQTKSWHHPGSIPDDHYNSIIVVELQEFLIPLGPILGQPLSWKNVWDENGTQLYKNVTAFPPGVGKHAKHAQHLPSSTYTHIIMHLSCMYILTTPAAKQFIGWSGKWG